MSPLSKFDSVKLQKVKRFIVDELMYIPSEVHDHGHVYILESRESFYMITNSPNANLHTH